MHKQPVKIASLGFFLGLLLPVQPLLANPARMADIGPEPITSAAAAAAAALPLRLELNVTKRQVTLYRGEQAVKTYPVAVGKPGWETPVGNFKVAQMFEDPVWQNPFSGGQVAGGDPENPLGRRWIGFWTDGKNWIGFHGTPNTASVGNAASHGCVRMYPQDIQELFSQVKVGIPVIVKK